jgi:hypothetical protein
MTTQDQDSLNLANTVPELPAKAGQLAPPPVPKGPLADLVAGISGLKRRLASLRDDKFVSALTPTQVEPSMKEVKQLQEDFTEILNILSSIRKDLAGRLETIRRANAKSRKNK